MLASLAVFQIASVTLLMAGPPNASVERLSFYRAFRDWIVGAGPAAIASADLNHDGNLDLVTANSVSGTVSVLLGNGGRTFQEKRDYSTGSGATSPNSVAIADFNGDGNPDIAVANKGTGQLAILFGDGFGNFGPASEVRCHPASSRTRSSPRILTPTETLTS